MTKIDSQDFEKHVRDYKQRKPVFEAMAVLLREVLEQAVKELDLSAEISVRAKGVPNFAEKTLRKPKGNPVEEFTDLCGARVTVHYLDEIEPVCAYIRRNFEIDEANSEDVVERLGSSRFGYRSVHFIVSLRPEAQDPLGALVKDIAKIRPEFRKNWKALYERRTSRECENTALTPGPRCKAEIQVRTLLQHAWATFAHDRIYKSEFKVPEQYERDTNRIAAGLEQLDAEFCRTMRAVESYRTYFGAYMDREAREAEIKKLELVLKEDKDNVRLARKIARLWISLEDKDKARRILAPYVKSWKSSAAGEDLRKLAVMISSNPEPTQQEAEKIAEVRERLQNRGAAGLLLDAGVAEASGSVVAQELLWWSVLLNRDNVHAQVARAEAEVDEREQLRLFEQAYRTDSSNPAALAGYIGGKIRIEKSLDFATMIAPSLGSAIQRCRDQADIRVNLPWAFYHAGLFHLVQGETEKALREFTVAVTFTDGSVILRQAWLEVAQLKHSLRKSGKSAADSEPFELAEMLLVLAVATRPRALIQQREAEASKAREAAAKARKAADQARKAAGKAGDAKEKKKYKAAEAEHRAEEAKHQSEEAKQRKEIKALMELMRRGREEAIALLKAEIPRTEDYRKAIDAIGAHREAVVIVAGGTGEDAKTRMEEHRCLLADSFAGLSCLLISGGTTVGICGIAGDLATVGKARIKAMAFMPAMVPRGSKEHPAYKELTISGLGTGWTARQPLVAWLALVAAGCEPETVRVLGINGGAIAGVEYRLGAMVGARVGVLRDSGRAATEAANDPDWFGKGIMGLPTDLQTVRVFLRPAAKAAYLTFDQREALAQVVHEEYRKEKNADYLKKDRALAPWDKLSEDLKQSNRDSVDYIEEKLRLIGLRIAPAGTTDFMPVELKYDQKEIMAEYEHGRWNVDKMLSGYRWGEVKDDKKKTHDCLKPYLELSEKIKDYDRWPVGEIPELLRSVGFKIVKA